MPTPPRKRLIVLLLVGLVVVGTAAAARWMPGRVSSRPRNAILVISPYDYKGTWVFDDASVGLVREPFVAGVPEMIDVLVKDVPDAKSGFRLLFSEREFPGYQKKLTWVRSTGDGNFYRFDDPPMEGWICPALFRYYDKAPAELYVRAEPIARG